MDSIGLDWIGLDCLFACLVTPTDTYRHQPLMTEKSRLGLLLDGPLAARIAASL
jgi:hypothetical protein